MGQKVHPEGLRLGINKDWKSKWLSKKDYKRLFLEDLKIKKYIMERLEHGGISKIEIERAGSKARIKIHTSKPGVIIGKKGTEVEDMKRELEDITGKQILIDPIEVKKPEIDAVLVADNIARQIEKRVSHRRAMKKAIQTAMEAGAQGIKVSCAGRLGGAEIARTEWYVEGRVPLQTLRADINYGEATAKTTYGTVGVKVWIYKGENLNKEEK